MQGSHAFVNKKFTTFSIPKFAQNELSSKDGSTVRSEFAYYVPRILNRTAPVYHTSVQFLKRIVPTYPTRTITEKGAPYFLAKIKAYRTVLPFLLLTTRDFN